MSGNDFTVIEKEPIFGNYQVLEQIGQGGFATVYRAKNLRLGNEVALKVMNQQLAQDAVFVRRFEQEARQTAVLDHPNIVRISDLDEQGGHFFLAMEFVEGSDLRQLLGTNDLLSLDQITNIIRQISSALDYAHECNLVHRDVKPSNILVRLDGTAKLTDFGIVKAATGSKLTQTGTMIGTPAYMSPEQTKGSTVDGRSDLYSLGVVTYEMITGQVPFAGDTPVTVGYKHVHESPPPPSQISGRAQNPIEAVLLKALAKEPADRYQTGLEFAVALETAVSDLTEQKLDATYQKAQANLDKYQYAAALQLLTDLQEIQPDFRDTAALILQAEQGLVLNKKYAEADQHFSAARILVMEVVSVDPDFPDEAGIIKTFTQGAQQQPFISQTNETAVTKRRPKYLLWGGAIVALLLIVSSVWIAFNRGNSAAPSGAFLLGTSWLRPADGMKMIYVPAGSFEMGSLDGDNDENPVHVVDLDAFWIDQTEINNARYNSCVSEGVCKEPQFANDSEYSGEEQPVIGVSWSDAHAYCQWVGGQLPTEAQWEYTAKGSTENSYPWGNAEPTCDLAQFNDCSGKTEHVESFQDGRSWPGALNLSGNVWEWVYDWYAIDYYEKSAALNPIGPQQSTVKVLRGGGWKDNSISLRNTNRHAVSSSAKFLDVGFRCVVSAR